MRFCLPSDLTAMIGLDRNADNYAELEILQDGIQALFEAYLNRELEQKVRVVPIHFTGSMIALQALPIRNVESVVITDAYGSDVNLSTNDYTVTPYGIKLVGYKAKASSFATVTYTGGLASVNNIVTSTDALDDKLVRALERAALQQIHYEYTRKENMGATSVSSEGGSTSFPELNLLKTVQQVLIAHKHPLGGFA